MALPEELLATLVVCLARLSAAGQLGLLCKMGLSADQVERVKALSLAEMNELSSLGPDFMDIRVDAVSFDRALAVLARRQAEQRLVERLLLAGACHPVMKRLTGMETREFVALRQRLGLAFTGSGRSPKPDAASQRRICQAWVESSGEPDMRLRLLKVHEATGMAIRALWPVVDAWEGQGDLPIGEADLELWQGLLNPKLADSSIRFARLPSSSTSSSSSSFVSHPPCECPR